MSLVAYGSSDEDSEVEKEEEVVTPSNPLPKKKDPVKITIPSLKEFEEEKKPEVKKKIQPKGGSGLLSILPPPKNSLCLSKPGFTPYVFSKKKETKPTQVQKPKQASVINKTISDKFSSGSEKSFDDPENPVSQGSEDSSEKVDFFSLNTKSTVGDQTLKQYEIKLNDIEVSASDYANFTKNEESIAEILTDDNNSSNISTASWEENDDFEPVASSSSINWGSLEMRNTVDLSESAGPPDFLKDEEFIKLKGRKEKGDINIIDVNVDDQLTGKDQWIMQSLTEETYQRPLKRRHDMPTSQQKRKHQITYLAFQAKERELALRNQWAMNGRTRRETQAKYGF